MFEPIQLEPRGGYGSPPPYSKSNGLVENAMGRIRPCAGSLMHYMGDVWESSSIQTALGGVGHSSMRVGLQTDMDLLQVYPHMRSSIARSSQAKHVVLEN